MPQKITSNQDKKDEKKETTEPNTYQCNVRCAYFPTLPDVVPYEVDEKTGIKRMPKDFQLTCKYDGHVITSWYDLCPRKVEKENGKSV